MAKKILIIDDDPTIRMLLSVSLKAKGMECIEATDGQEGFREALIQLPDLIVMDLSMPNMNGFEACDRLRAHEKTRAIPILILSGESTSLNQEILSGALKANGFLAKPFDRAKLFDALAKVLPGFIQ